ncbi:MAG: bifunctional (p)ppGpp synthetase/guanosine-3',5'-bis(diphosphate) 3'-pyrophosphohydrolase [Fimbriimonadaceae bacterium]|nr:bifunctional (p)ppGpp synthetase/guanosine-3',5'-bis(diphosphate) 3'-pyrophosphohydrolase [Fimbriimonadaceae bacterium]
MSELLQRAFAFSVERHRGVFRDGEMALPYGCHPADVARILRVYGGVKDEVVLAASFLHDTVEDTDTTLEEIESEFGPKVASIVKQVTRIEPAPEELQGMSSDESFWYRNELFMKEIDEMGPEAQQIKLADRLSNLEECRYTRSAQKLSRYNRQTAMILDHIPEAVNPKLHRKLTKLHNKVWSQLAND